MFLLEGFLFVCCMFVFVLFLLLFFWDLLIYLVVVVVVVVTKMIVKFRIPFVNYFMTSQHQICFCFGCLLFVLLFVVVCLLLFVCCFFVVFVCFLVVVWVLLFVCFCFVFVCFWGGFFIGCLGFIYTSLNNSLNVPVIHVPDGIPITAVINMFTVIINRMLYCRIYSHSKVSFRFQRNFTKHNWVK